MRSTLAFGRCRHGDVCGTLLLWRRGRLRVCWTPAPRRRGHRVPLCTPALRRPRRIVPSVAWALGFLRPRALGLLRPRGRSAAAVDPQGFRRRQQHLFVAVRRRRAIGGDGRLALQPVAQHKRRLGTPPSVACGKGWTWGRPLRPACHFRGECLGHLDIGFFAAAALRSAASTKQLFNVAAANVRDLGDAVGAALAQQPLGRALRQVGRALRQVD